MTTFLFWNLMGNHAKTWTGRRARLATSLGRLALGAESRYPVDVVILAECRFTAAEVIAALGGGFVYHSNVSDRVQVFARSTLEVATRFDDTVTRRLTVKRVTTRVGAGVLLAGVHLPSARERPDPADRAMAARAAAASIARSEPTDAPALTAVVGDFNMDPDDPGMTAPDAFHAVMDRGTATRGPRTVDGVEHHYFYNPMWGCFGDRTPGPTGTHYYVGSSSHVHWHVYDQVLLRPALVSKLADLRVLDRDGRPDYDPDSLITETGRPSRARLSDHLPILFRLDV